MAVSDWVTEWRVRTLERDAERGMPCENVEYQTPEPYTNTEGYSDDLVALQGSSYHEHTDGFVCTYPVLGMTIRGPLWTMNPRPEYELVPAKDLRNHIVERAKALPSVSWSCIDFQTPIPLQPGVGGKVVYTERNGQVTYANHQIGLFMHGTLVDNATPPAGTN